MEACKIREAAPMHNKRIKKKIKLRLLTWLSISCFCNACKERKEHMYISAMSRHSGCVFIIEGFLLKVSDVDEQVSGIRIRILALAHTSKKKWF